MAARPGKRCGADGPRQSNVTASPSATAPGVRTFA
jgi:hypothetical protein